MGVLGQQGEPSKRQLRKEQRAKRQEAETTKTHGSAAQKDDRTEVCYNERRDGAACHDGGEGGRGGAEVGRAIIDTMALLNIASCCQINVGRTGRGHRECGRSQSTVVT